MQRQRDPWEPFRLWLALTIGLYALRAFFAVTWVGAIPGWVLLVSLLALVRAGVIDLHRDDDVRPGATPTPDTV